MPPGNKNVKERQEAIEKRLSLAREGGGILLLFAAAFLGLSLLTYHPADPSFNHAGAERAVNFAGLIGAYLSDMLFQTLGYAALWLPLILIFVGFKLFRKKAAEFYWDRVVTLPVLILASCPLLAFLPPDNLLSLPAGTGGVIGQLGAHLMTPFLGRWGSVLLLIPLALLSLMILTRFSAVAFALRSLVVVTWIKTIGVRAKALWKRWSMAFTGWLIRRKERKKRSKEREERKAEENPAPPPKPKKSGKEERKEPEMEAPPPPPPTQEKIKTPPPPRPKKPKQENLPFDLEEMELLEDALPPLSLLTSPEPDQTGPDRESLEMKGRILEKKLADFGVKGKIIEARPGPVVTTFELEPAPGLKASKVIGLSDDLARSITAVSVRVVGSVPGKPVIGIEIPNETRQTVFLREVLESPQMKKINHPLAVALGSDINGDPAVTSLAKMPHLLVAGTTGSGKSVAVNAMICSILYRAKPDEVRFLMVDPKMLELSIYEGIPHLLSPVVTDVRKAANLLQWAVGEMENRYKLMSEMGVRNLAGFNDRVKECLETGEQPTRVVRTGFDMETGRPTEEEQPIPLEPIPLIVIIIDELADLMMTVGKEVEQSIARLAQMARAAGLHLVLATQRPSVDVLTGLIKANFPTRLSFQVSSKIDSRTILDTQGAESLLGMGDGLFMPPGTSRLMRIHAPFVSDGEIHKLVKFLKKTGKPNYNPDVLLAQPGGDDGGGEGGGGAGGGADEYDALYDESAALVAKQRKVSTSMIQRHFKIGYNRAARIVEQMEKDGLISEANSQGKREVLGPPPQQDY